MSRWLLVFALCLLLLAGCFGSSAVTSVWIDVPLNPTTLSEVQTVVIEGHAASPEGVSQVDVWVNGTLIESISSLSAEGSLAAFESRFTPGGPGEYTIRVQATGVNGVESAPDETVVLIGTEFTAIEIDPIDPSPTPVDPTPVPEIVDLPADDEPYVDFWADPEEITAGDCTTLHWETQNVAEVVFAGVSQPLSGSDMACFCSQQTFPLTVTYKDNSTETFYVTVETTGVCHTITPVPDTTPPNPPTLLKPLNGDTLACVAEAILRWDDVSDTSGIEEYRLEVQRHPGDNDWKPVSGSPFIVHNDTNLTLSTECAYTYRWRVRALDKAGNLGDWSGWFSFVVNFG